MIDSLQFSWKYKNYELRACPKHLVRINKDDPNVTIDFIKWEKQNDGKPYCFSIGYFLFSKDGYDFKFVGDRFFEHIEKKDRGKCLDGLCQAQLALDQFYRDNYNNGTLNELCAIFE